MYPHSNTLNNDLTHFKYPTVHICLFSIVTNAKIPFVKYILQEQKQLQKKMLCFPKMELDDLLDKDFDKDLNKDLEQKVKKEIIGSFFKEPEEQELAKKQEQKQEQEQQGGFSSSLEAFLQGTNKKPEEPKIAIKGYYEWEQKGYLFVQWLNVDEYDSMDFYPWGVLISELLHSAYICNALLDPTIGQMFRQNPFLCHFYNAQQNDIYENPEIGYYSVGSNQGIDHLDFIQLFGARKHAKNGPLGPFYYFTNDFNMAVKMAGWTSDGQKAYKYEKQITTNQGKYFKGGIVRFALFVGKMTYIRYPDEFDSSKQNANWATHFDACYVGTGVLNEKNALVVVKNHNQQCVLATYTLRMNMLGDTWDPLCNYQELPILF